MNVSRTETSRDDWQSPDGLLDHVRAFYRGYIDYDPLTSPDNPVRALTFDTIKTDGFTFSWCGKGNIWVNPPFSAIPKRRALEFAAEAGQDNATVNQVIVLVPANTGPKWFQELVFCRADAICWLKGRLKFKGAPTPAKFDCCLAYFGHNNYGFRDHFRPLGFCT